MSMEPTEEYPLKQIVQIKKKRVEEAEKNVQEKQKIVEREEETLRQVEEVRNGSLRHYQEKLEQLRASLDAGTTSDRIRQMRDYMKVVKDRLNREEAKVKEQKKKVDTAIQELEGVKKILQEKRKEAEKLDTHEEEWTKAHKIEEAKLQERSSDEIGTTIFYGKKKKD